MENIESLVKSTLQEIEKILSTKSIIGEPVQMGSATIIPLIQLGFGFGIGSGGGKGPNSIQGEGSGSGVGGGGGVKPVAMIIIDKDGCVRIEPVIRKGSMIEKIGNVIPVIMDKMGEKRREGEDKKEG
jgi:uncharacterized spore protein YtfJ